MQEELPPFSPTLGMGLSGHGGISTFPIFPLGGGGEVFQQPRGKYQGSEDIPPHPSLREISGEQWEYLADQQNRNHSISICKMGGKYFLLKLKES